MSLRFEIFNNNGFSREIDPITNYEISGKLEKNEFYFNNEIPSLKIKRPDYDELIQFENSFEPFYVNVFCNGNMVFRGKTNFTTADICKDRCTIDFTLKQDSPMLCLRENDQEVNILAAPIPQVSSELPELVSNLEFYITVEKGANVFPPVDPGSWGEYAYIAPLFTGAIATCCEVFGYQIYAREVVTDYCIAGVPNPPSGAVVIQNNCAIDGTYTYARPYVGTNPIIATPLAPGLGTHGCFKIENDIFQPPVDHGSWTYLNSDIVNSDCSGLGSDPACSSLPGWFFTANFFVDYDCLANSNPLTGNSIDHSRRLDDTINYLLEQLPCGVNCFESDFLFDATNYVTGQNNKLNDLFITEMGDVTRPFASGQATVLNLSLFGLYEQLKEMFNLIIRVNENGCLEIEHVSRAFQNVIKLSDIGELVNVRCCYKTDLESVPKCEKWEWNEADNIDFVGRDIEYRGSDGLYYTDTECETHDVTEVSTDIEYLYDAYNGNPPQPPVTNLDGYVITSNFFDGTNWIVCPEIGVITGSQKLNGHLSQANLHDNYWRDYRYYINGFLNSQQTNFTNVRPNKENEDIVLKLCCEDFNNFNLEYKIIDLTECKCGFGIVTSYKWNYQTKELTLKINLQ